MSKKDKLPVILIGHITKEGNLAGPKVLEHLVDTVLQFEGDRNYAYRILRTMKNRFGSTDELGIYAMEEGGLRQVHNPSELLLSEKDHQLSGSAVAAMVEGMRPLCIEVQALVSTAVYGVPQRQATGFDTKRMHMLLAVLEKRCGFHFGHNDVFVNIAGGLHVEDPGIDLAVVAACISSLENIPIDPRMCFAGEVGLSGEVRSVSRLEMRIAEAGRLGFTDIWIPKAGFKGTLKSPTGIQVHAIGRVDELYANLFKQ
jgi:DNA repair protein RadA/Sms